MSSILLNSTLSVRKYQPFIFNFFIFYYIYLVYIILHFYLFILTPIIPPIIEAAIRIIALKFILKFEFIVLDNKYITITYIPPTIAPLKIPFFAIFETLNMLPIKILIDAMPITT